MPTEPRTVWGDLATTAFIESAVLFKSLDAEALEDLLQLATQADYQPGEVIAEDPSDEKVWLIRDGRAAVLVPRAGAEVEVARLERGGLFGEGRVLGAPVPARLVAVTEAQVIALPAPVMAALAERFPRLRKLLEAVRAARLKDVAAGPEAGA
jgi:signal-transduction protein with cAMP-binding, CBS, and nucleotidyltransferase domain